MPTFDTRMSAEPNASTQEATSFAASASWDTSAITPMARPPAAAISATTRSTAARSLAPLTTTAAPFSASMSAVLRPIFLPEPVTIAARPDSSSADKGVNSTNNACGSLHSFRLDADRRNDATPVFDLVLHARAELIRRVADRRRALLLELGDDLGALQRVDHDRIQAIDDRLWRAGRREHADPGRGYDARNGFGDGRQIGEVRAALRFDQGQHPDRAGGGL